MRKKLFKGIMGVALMLTLAVGLSSCESDDYWYDGPGWNDVFYDRDLNGYWELVQVNSNEVIGSEKNFLYFNGNGRGYYYFWSNGRQYVDNTAYECQYSNTGLSDYQMNLWIGNDRPSTMNYWFTNGYNTMFMQWRENGRPVTYVYDRIYRAPW